MTRLGRVGIGIVVPVVIFLAWWALSEGSSSPYFPPLGKIFAAFAEIWFFARFFTDLLPTVGHFLSGLAVGVVVGVVVGTLMGLFSRFRHDVSPMTEFVRAIPTAALVPLGLILFGTGFVMETFLISMAVLFPVLVSTTAGVRSVDPIYLEVARSYGLSFADRLWRVIIPAATPQILAGCRVAIAFGLAAAIIANMVASGSGLGFFIVDSQTSFRLTDMWAGLMMIGLLGYLANTAFVLVEHRLLIWHRGWRGASQAARAE